MARGKSDSAAKWNSHAQWPIRRSIGKLEAHFELTIDTRSRFKPVKASTAEEDSFEREAHREQTLNIGTAVGIWQR